MALEEVAGDFGRSAPAGAQEASGVGLELGALRRSTHYLTLRSGTCTERAHGTHERPAGRMCAVVVSRQYVDVPVDGRAMRTFVVAPRAPGPHPGIVFYSDIFQLTEPTLRWCVRLAGYGFVVAAPEIYHRLEPPGTVLDFDDEGKVRGQRDAEQTSIAEFDADIRAALEYLGGHAAVGGAALGAAGHCTGGHLAFRAAMAPEVRATAWWYATGLHDG
jgi:carboxymethylenebutenolidase